LQFPTPAGSQSGKIKKIDEFQANINKNVIGSIEWSNWGL